MSAPVERISALRIGGVDYVSADEIKVLLELDAPEATALNTGVPNRFPRINGYILMPNESGGIVGLVTWVGIERSAFPKRTGLRDFGLIDLPFPLRKMSVTPLGTLVKSLDKESQTYGYRLNRGIYSFPSVGDAVLLPTPDQLKSIVEAHGSDRRVPIGRAPLADGATVSIDPDKIFGRHLAVLGNTGSGKSCSVSGLIRWSVENAKAAIQNKSGVGHARFVILDPNGEYLRTFSDLGTSVKTFQVQANSATRNATSALSVPAWMWNSSEWCAFASAAAGTQRPLLLQALRDLRAGQITKETKELAAARLVRSYKLEVERRKVEGVTAYGSFPGQTNFGQLLRNIETDMSNYASFVENNLGARLTSVASSAKAIADGRFHKYFDKQSGEERTTFNAFAESDLNNILQKLDAVLVATANLKSTSKSSEDAPIEFDVEALPDHLEFLARESGSPQLVQFVSTLAMRIRMMLADQRLCPIVNPTSSIGLEKWLEDLLGKGDSTDAHIAVLDLSLVPSDVLHLVISVVARIVFEALQRFRRLEGKELPTVLVLEEAHNFVRKYEHESESTAGLTQMCRQTFERIAREGRKFGLGLVLSSQRPSEISATVLAQCNTFLLHRIVNDRDQELVSRLIPDNLGGLLRELPSLPARQAVLLGWASAVPVLVEMKELPPTQRPHSADPEFWDVWTGISARKMNWSRIDSDWTT